MKKITYPLIVLTSVFIIIFALLSFIRKIGTETKGRSNISFETKNINTFSIWRDNQSFFISSTGDKSIYDSSIKRPETAKTLKDTQTLPKSVFFILRFDSGKEDLNEFLHQLSKFEINQVLIASPNDSTLKNLRSLESNFYYAPSIKNLLKWSVFSRLYIETIFNIKSDFIYVDKKVDRLLNKSLIKEIKRRALPLCSFEKKLECVL